MSVSCGVKIKCTDRFENLRPPSSVVVQAAFFNLTSSTSNIHLLILTPPSSQTCVSCRESIQKSYGQIWWDFGGEKAKELGVQRKQRNLGVLGDHNPKHRQILYEKTKESRYIPWMIKVALSKVRFRPGQHQKPKKNPKKHQFDKAVSRRAERTSRGISGGSERGNVRRLGRRERQKSHLGGTNRLFLPCRIPAFTS